MGAKEKKEKSIPGHKRLVRTTLQKTGSSSTEAGGATPRPLTDGAQLLLMYICVTSNGHQRS